MKCAPCKDCKKRPRVYNGVCEKCADPQDRIVQAMKDERARVLRAQRAQRKRAFRHR